MTLFYRIVMISVCTTLLAACSSRPVTHQISPDDYRIWITSDYAPENDVAGKFIYISRTTLEVIDSDITHKK